MTMAAVSYSTAIAVASTVLFAIVLAVTRLKHFVPRSRLLCLEFISNEPAQHLRQRWQKLSQQRSLCLLPLLFFSIVEVALIVAEPTPSWFSMTDWLQVAVVALAALASTALAIRGLLLTLQRRRLRPEIDARLTIGSVLQKIAVNRNRVFHDVPTAFGRIDHVIAGLHGVYAINVVARRPRKNAYVVREDDRLKFSDGSNSLSIKNAQKLAARLAQEGGKILGHGMHVRLIIAVPGWEVHTQSGDDVLVTNERHINMLTGWKDQRDYLLDEDVTVLHGHLDEKTVSRSGPIS